jgi:hypothetical protein
MAGENVSTALGILWAPKDKGELELVETAAQVTSAVHAHFTDVILDLVDNETVRAVVAPAAGAAGSPLTAPPAPGQATRGAVGRD